MKTRSNMPLFVLEVSDVKALSNSQIDLLRCGDYLVKKDASGEHAYKVTFKSDTGMCLTYHDASVIETQSYDKVEGNWVYNSEDKTENLLDVATKDDIEGGTISNAKPIYFHPIRLQITATFGGSVYRVNCSICVLNNSPTQFTYASLSKWVYDNNILLIADGPVVLGTDNSFAGTVAYWSRYNEESMNINWIRADGVANTGSVAGSEVVAFDDSGVNKIN